MNRLFKFSLLALIIFPVFAVSAMQIFFTDVRTDHQYFAAIKYVKEKDIVSGYIGNTYRPQQNINRAEFTKIVVNATVDGAVIKHCQTNQKIQFSDVPTDAWFYDFVCAASLTQIINGYSDGTFKPGQNINFAEAAKILVSAFGYNTNQGASWFEPYVKALEVRRAIPPSIQAFDYAIDRGEMAELIWRMKNNLRARSSHTYLTLMEGKSPLPSLAAGSSIPDPITQTSSTPNTQPPASTPTNPPIDPNPNLAARDQILVELINLINNARSTYGAHALASNELLRASAQGYANDQLTHNYYGGPDHVRRDGSTLEMNIDSVGYTLSNLVDCTNCSMSRRVAENIAQGQKTAQSVFDSWMDSPLHRFNMLSTDLDDIGLGVSGLGTSNTIWVANFGAIRTAPVN